MAARIENIGDILLGMGLAGIPAAYGVSKGIENVNKNYEDMNTRLQKVTPVNMAEKIIEEQMKTGSENKSFKSFREKRAGAADLASMFNPNFLLGGMLHGAVSAAKVTDPLSRVLGYDAYKRLQPGIGGMISYTAAPETALESGAKEIGKGLGGMAIGGVRDLVNSIISKNKQIVIDSPRRKMILDQLRREDDVIAKLPIEKALEAFHTMGNVAPTLSTDKNAVRSFLRTVAVNPMGGLDWNTIKGLAEAETAVKRAKGLIPTKQ